jgi:hypothetical protein
MNIGILGWWRAGNQGDFAIRENLERVLAPHHVVPIDLPFHMTRDELDRLNLLDFLLLGGGGLFQATPPIPFDTFDEWGPQLKTPIGVVGVGIDTVTPRFQPAVQALVDQACFFYVRDRDSQELVNHPKVQVAPDLSFLYPLPRSVNLSPSRSWPVCGVNLRKVPSLDVDRWIKTLRRLPVRLRGIPLSTFGAWEEVQTLRQFDETCPAAFDPSLYQNLDVMVGMAFHSVVFAIQAGIPTIAIAYAPKVRRMFDHLGLGQWLLDLDEWDRLPELVERATENRSQLVDFLQETTTGLTQAARDAMTLVKREIERVARPCPRSGPRVSMIVVGAASEAHNRLTLTSCLNQTYDNLEITVVGDGVQDIPSSMLRSPDQLKYVPASLSESWADRLNRALAQTTGDCLSWITAGNYYVPDAISCMVAGLERNAGCDMVFAGYYTLYEADRIAYAHSVEPAYKLFRANVVGPCFLFRRRLREGVGSLNTETPCASYDYWLRAYQFFKLRPIHARLLFALMPQDAVRDRQVERQVRRQWRSKQVWPLRVFGQLVDTDLVDRYMIRPLMAVLRKIVALLHHNR